MTAESFVKNYPTATNVVVKLLSEEIDYASETRENFVQGH